MGLARYRQKRDFKKTAEPSGAGTPRARTKAVDTERLFVVQQHHASRPHFDFRLELDGVLKSWAVPKGPSLDPADKRLAVEVEDHPLDYADFEGTIPKGQYGGGSVIVWDTGVWTPGEDQDPARAHRDGSMKVELHGKKLRGGWALVRMKTRDGEKNNWLLIKEKDKYAKPAADFDVIARKPKSVLSGRLIEQIGEPGDREWNSNAPVKKKSRKTTPRKKTTKRVAASTKKRTPPPAAAAETAHAPTTLHGAVPADMPETLEPQLATLVEVVPVGDDWIHEVKFDGYRILAFVRDDAVRLLTRNGNDWSRKFPEIRDALQAATLPDAILDGEIVALDKAGLSHFQNLQRALMDDAAGDLVLFLFDVPYCAGMDLTNVPLVERRALLRELVRTLPPASRQRVRFSEAIEGHGGDVLKQACRLRLEGVLSKRADAPYTPGRTTSWRKLKCGHRQEFVIGGYTEPKGSRAAFGSLLMGYYTPRGELTYAGKVGAGFDADDLRRIGTRLRANERDDSPFKTAPRESARHWVEPRLVAEIGFTEWTGDGRLRHPVFLGLREDKEATDVKRETATRAKPRTTRARKAPASPPPSTRTTGTTRAASDVDAVVAGVRISNPHRVVYPDVGLTKLDIARYYETIADVFLPLGAHRPLSLVRCPAGSTGHCFFHKHIEDKPGDGLRAIPIKESGGEGVYSAIMNVKGLISLVQMNALELHAWGCRIDDIERPDRLVFDLDPGEGVKWPRVVEAAMAVRAVFEQMKLRSFVMTSGGKGLHVVVPIQRHLGWDRAKAFGKSVAKAMEQAEPAKYVANMSKAKRSGRVFIDYLRIQRGATSIAPYSTRARLGAPVAMPVEWDAIRDVKPDAFGVTNAPAHIKSRPRDPWEEMPSLRQRIPAAFLVSQE